MPRFKFIHVNKTGPRLRNGLVDKKRKHINSWTINYAVCIFIALRYVNVN